MAAMTLIVGATRRAIPELFLGAHAPQSAETMELAATLLVLGASFFILDGVQAASGGALRGLNDTRMPLVVAVLSYWMIGFVSCVWFGFRIGLGAIGVWIGLSLGTAIYAALLVWRFHALTARNYLPAIPALT
jgi:MATE family multidrug resistance protein